MNVGSNQIDHLKILVEVKTRIFQKLREELYSSGEMNQKGKMVVGLVMKEIGKMK